MQSVAEMTSPSHFNPGMALGKEYIFGLNLAHCSNCCNLENRGLLVVDSALKKMEDLCEP